MINNGVAFGLFPGFPVWVVGLILIGLIFSAVKMRELWGRVGVGMIIVGGVGNLLSRWLNGGILDNWNFLGLFYNNVWDYLIVGGVVVYGVSKIKHKLAV